MNYLEQLKAIFKGDDVHYNEDYNSGEITTNGINKQQMADFLTLEFITDFEIYSDSTVVYHYSDVPCSESSIHISFHTKGV